MAWNAALPTNSGLLINAPAQIRANWEAVALGTDASLLITNAKVASGAGIVESKLTFSATGHGHTGSTDGKQVVLTTAVSGTLPIANGGTNATVANTALNNLLPAQAAAVNKFLQSDGTNTTWALANIQVAVGAFTRDLTAANGTQESPSLGFSPKAVFLFAGVESATPMSIGFDDGSTSGCIASRNAVAANTWNVGSTKSIVMITSASDQNLAEVTTLGADTFTLTWTKTNSPTGTCTINYLALG